MRDAACEMVVTSDFREAAASLRMKDKYSPGSYCISAEIV